MFTTGHPGGLWAEHNGLLSKATVQLLFMLTRVFLKALFLAHLCFYYTSMTLLPILLHLSDYLQMTVLYRVIHSEHDHHLLQLDLN